MVFSHRHISPLLRVFAHIFGKNVWIDFYFWVCCAKYSLEIKDYLEIIGNYSSIFNKTYICHFWLQTGAQSILHIIHKCTNLFLFLSNSEIFSMSFFCNSSYFPVISSIFLCNILYWSSILFFASTSWLNFSFKFPYNSVKPSRWTFNCFESLF